MANITQKCRCHHQKEGHMLIQPSILEIRSYYVILGGEHSRIVLYGYIYIWMCLKMGGTHRCPFQYIIGENDEYGMHWDTHPQKLGMSTSS